MVNFSPACRCIVLCINNQQRCNGLYICHISAADIFLDAFLWPQAAAHIKRFNPGAVIVHIQKGVAVFRRKIGLALFNFAT
jgi:hypothetical protein